MKTISEHNSFGGVQGYYSHASKEIGLEMRFAVYLPPQAASAKLPVLFYLAGLTCTEDTFVIKAGAQRVAAELGLILVSPDTSPRGAGIPGDADTWDFGVGAGVDVRIDPQHRGRGPPARVRQIGQHLALLLQLQVELADPRIGLS